MAKTAPKIVLLKDGVDAADFASSTFRSMDVFDAFSTMQTDFIPEPESAAANVEGGFFAAELTPARIKKLEAAPEVLAVVDDEKVFAFDTGRADPPQGGESFDFDYDLESFLPDTEEAAEAIRVETSAEGDEAPPELTAEQLRLLCEVEPDVGPELDLEYSLNEEFDGPSFEGVAFPTIAKPDLLKLLKCLAKCLLDGGGAGSEDLADEDAQAVLSKLGIEAGALETAQADRILRNLYLIYAPYAWRYSTGRGVRVAVLDTGIARRHRDLIVRGGVSYVPGVASWNDDHGHGTHCAGIIAARRNGGGIVGVAPDAYLYAVKVLNGSGSGRLSWILNGLVWCLRRRMHIASLSLGSPVNTHNPRVFNQAYEQVAWNLRRYGRILCVAAAGNDSHRPVGNPARCPSFLAVSAIDYSRRLTTFTNVGPQVELCAPGYRILSTVPTGYAVMSGTSMACPHVSGVAALVKARFPTLTGDQIRVRMWRTALDLGAAGRDWAFGFGQVNAYRAVR